jgi:hypothetical protein
MGGRSEALVGTRLISWGGLQYGCSMACEAREEAEEVQYPPGCAVSGGANLYNELLRTPLLGTSEKSCEEIASVPNISLRPPS